MSSSRSDSTPNATSIVPEDLLLQELSPLWKRRFGDAIELIIANLSSPLHWDAIAEQCAITPNHFHQLFRSVMGETPGQYRIRMSLKHAVYHMYASPHLSITDIAHSAGFSSSQALAKALKRDVGITATTIRKAKNSDPIWKTLDEKLSHSHPSDGSLIEKKLADNILFSTAQISHRYYYELANKDRTHKPPEEYWLEQAPSSANTLAYIYQSASNSSSDQGIQGDYSLAYSCNKNKSTIELPDTNYLHCRLVIGSESGYFSAWESLYAYVTTHDIELANNATTLELLHNIRSKERHLEISLYVAIKK